MGTARQAPCLCSEGGPCQRLLFRSHQCPLLQSGQGTSQLGMCRGRSCTPRTSPGEPLCLPLPWQRGSRSPPCHNHPQLCLYQPALCTWEDATVRAGSVTFIICLVRLRVILMPFPEAVFSLHLPGKPPATSSPDNPASFTATLTPTNRCWNVIQPLLNTSQAGSATHPSHT